MGHRAALALLAVVAGCGARTALDVDAVDHADASSMPDAAPEVSCVAYDFPLSLTSPSFAVTKDYVIYASAALDGLTRTDKNALTTQALSGWPGTFAADDSYVYWVDDHGTLMRSPTAGGAAEPLGCGAPSGCPTSVLQYTAVLAVTAQRVFVAQPASDNRIYSIPYDGGPPTPLSTSVTTPVGPIRTFAADDARVLWSTDERVYGDSVGGTDLTPTVYADWPGGVALRGGFMSWTRRAGGQWRLARRAEGSSTASESPAGEVRGPIGVNASFAYGGRADGGVAKVPWDGGPSVVLAPGPVVDQIVVDGLCVYFTASDGSGRFVLRRVPG